MLNEIESPNEEKKLLLSQEIEKAQNDRIDLLKNILVKIVKDEKIQRVANSLVNATVGSYITLSLEAWRGKTAIGNQELTPLGRIMDIIIISTAATAYTTVFNEKLRPLGGMSYAVSWAGWGVMHGPDVVLPIIAKMADATRESNPKTSSLLQTLKKGIEKSKMIWFKKDTNNE